MLVFSGGLFKFDKDLKPYRYLRDLRSPFPIFA